MTASQATDTSSTSDQSAIIEQQAAHIARLSADIDDWIDQVARRDELIDAKDERLNSWAEQASRWSVEVSSLGVQIAEQSEQIERLTSAVAAQDLVIIEQAQRIAGL